MGNSSKYIALIGNPNCGKSTLFNRLTGLRQKTSNLPGTTVEHKSGIWKDGAAEHRLKDLPGIYSLYTHSDDEKIVVQHLLGIEGYTKPEAILFLLNATNLRRNLLLFTQVAELNFPISVALTMSDTATKRGIEVNAPLLSEELGVPVAEVNPRKGLGIDLVANLVKNARVPKKIEANTETNKQLHDFHGGKLITGLSHETLKRYQWIEPAIKKTTWQKPGLRKNVTILLDKIFTHKILGFLAFSLLMLTIFQGVYTLAEYPMQWIEQGFGSLSLWMKHQLPTSFLTGLITDGLIPGIAGVVVFVPQIAILFFFIGILEDSGYMVRASFITDKLMSRIGLNGRSVIPLIGGFACAIPSIMATRSIKNKAERLATMFVIPLMSCSARLPVYILLISIAVPNGARWGPIGIQSLVMTLAYFAGIILAAIIARLMTLFRNSHETSEFILELPPYQAPRLQNVLTNVWHKSRSFITEAGKVIVVISILLWLLASYGPGDSMSRAETNVHRYHSHDLPYPSKPEMEANVAAARLEASYAGHIGKFIEPAIQPLGYDWKTGIALVSSFAAREVFVGTMSTLFVAGKDDVVTIRARMQESVNPKTGKPLYGLPYALSLIVFYAFALQCMSTMAVMKRETGTWKWPLIQFFLYGTIAYVAAFLVFQLSLKF